MKVFLVLNSILLLSVFGPASSYPQTLGSARCVNMWDEGCINGQLPGSGDDDNYLNGGFNPGKRCINMWDEGCVNGQLSGSGGDDDYLLGGFNSGKRSLDALIAKLMKTRHPKSNN